MQTKREKRKKVLRKLNEQLYQEVAKGENSSSYRLTMLEIQISALNRKLYSNSTYLDLED